MAAKKKRAAAKKSESLTRRTRGRAREEAEFPVPPARGAMPSGYSAVLADLKQRIHAAQSRAAIAVNRELMALYWHVGRTIVDRQAKRGWGDSVVERLAYDLRRAFPDLAGFSPRNIWRMRAFYAAWSALPEFLPQAVAEIGGGPGKQKLPQAVAELPWGHNVLLLEKLDRSEHRLWYAERAREQGWSRATLSAQIEKKLHARQGRATTNFARTLPSPQSELAQQALKDPYTFDFLTVGSEASERVAERDLVGHVREFLLELGVGFAFLGSQVKLIVGGTEYFIDLLFYHVKPRCYVVVELKAKAFKPEHVGQTNFYLSAVDDLLRHPDDQPSIGLLLCRSRDRVKVEYALRGIKKPIGVAEWETKVVAKLPKELRGSLPTVEEIEAELGEGEARAKLARKTPKRRAGRR